MHRDDRSGSCRSLSPPYLRSETIITAPQQTTNPPPLQVRFVPLCGIILTSVASHVAHQHLIGQGVLGEISLYGFKPL